MELLSETYCKPCRLQESAILHKDMLFLVKQDIEDCDLAQHPWVAQKCASWSRSPLLSNKETYFKAGGLESKLPADQHLRLSSVLHGKCQLYSDWCNIHLVCLVARFRRPCSSLLWSEQSSHCCMEALMLQVVFPAAYSWGGLPAQDGDCQQRHQAGEHPFR